MLNQVNIMKTRETFTFKNRHLILQTFDEGTPNSHTCPANSHSLTFLSRSEGQPPGQGLNSQQIKGKYWNQTQQQLFNQFWLQQFIENPSQNFSFDAPLKRKSYNKALSDYIRKRSKDLNVECYKTPLQCKSKFGTLRRKIQRQRKTLGEESQKEFIDFILEKAQSMEHPSSGINDKIQKVKELRRNYSPFVKLILEEYNFQKSSSYRNTYESIVNYNIKTSKSMNSGMLL